MQPIFVLGNTFVKSSTTDFNEVMLEFNGDEGIKTYLYFSCDKNTLVSKSFLYTEDTDVSTYTYVKKV